MYRPRVSIGWLTWTLSLVLSIGLWFLAFSLLRVVTWAWGQL